MNLCKDELKNLELDNRIVRRNFLSQQKMDDYVNSITNLFQEKDVLLRVV